MSQIQHIGVIMDGNRRFAKRLMLEPWKGHEYGKEKFKKVLEWIKALDIKEATFYTFSQQNFNRPQKEFEYLMKLFEEAFEEIMQQDDFEKIKLKFDLLDRLTDFQKKFKTLSSKLKKKHNITTNTSLISHLAMEDDKNC